MDNEKREELKQAYKVLVAHNLYRRGKTYSEIALRALLLALWEPGMIPQKA